MVAGRSDSCPPHRLPWCHPWARRPCPAWTPISNACTRSPDRCRPLRSRPSAMPRGHQRGSCANQIKLRSTGAWLYWMQVPSCALAIMVQGIFFVLLAHRRPEGRMVGGHMGKSPCRWACRCRCERRDSPRRIQTAGKRRPALFFPVNRVLVSVGQHALSPLRLSKVMPTGSPFGIDHHAHHFVGLGVERLWLPVVHASAIKLTMDRQPCSPYTRKEASWPESNRIRSSGRRGSTMSLYSQVRRTPCRARYDAGNLRQNLLDGLPLAA